MTNRADQALRVRQLPRNRAAGTGLIRVGMNVARLRPGSHGERQDLVQDRTIDPVEIKKSANLRAESAQIFSTLDRFKPSWSAGGVVCLCRERLPLTEKVTAIPIGLL